jgi:hypothetical protein
MMFTVLNITSTTAVKYMATVQPSEPPLEISKPFLGVTFERRASTWSGSRLVSTGGVAQGVTFADKGVFDGASTDAGSLLEKSVGLVGMWFSNPWKRRESGIVSDVIRGVYVLYGSKTSLNILGDSTARTEDALARRDVILSNENDQLDPVHFGLSVERNEPRTSNAADSDSGAAYMGHDAEGRESTTGAGAGMAPHARQGASDTHLCGGLVSDVGHAANDRRYEPLRAGPGHVDGDDGDGKHQGLEQDATNQRSRADMKMHLQQAGGRQCASLSGVCVDVVLEVNVGDGGSITQNDLLQNSKVQCMRW